MYCVSPPLWEETRVCFFFFSPPRSNSNNILWCFLTPLSPRCANSTFGARSVVLCVFRTLTKSGLVQNSWRAIEVALQMAASRYVHANIRSYFDPITEKKKNWSFSGFLSREEPASVSAFNVFRLTPEPISVPGRGDQKESVKWLSLAAAYDIV